MQKNGVHTTDMAGMDITYWSHLIPITIFHAAKPFKNYIFTSHTFLPSENCFCLSNIARAGEWAMKFFNYHAKMSKITRRLIIVVHAFPMGAGVCGNSAHISQITNDGDENIT